MACSCKCVKSKAVKCPKGTKKVCKTSKRRKAAKKDKPQGKSQGKK